MGQIATSLCLILTLSRLFDVSCFDAMYPCMIEGRDSSEREAKTHEPSAEKKKSGRLLFVTFLLLLRHAESNTLEQPP